VLSEPIKTILFTQHLLKSIQNANLFTVKTNYRACYKKVTPGNNSISL